MLSLQGATNEFGLSNNLKSTNSKWLIFQTHPL